MKRRGFIQALAVAGPVAAVLRAVEPAPFRCVIHANVRKYTLKSRTWSVELNRPERHLIMVAR